MSPYHLERQGVYLGPYPIRRCEVLVVPLVAPLGVVELPLLKHHDPSVDLPNLRDPLRDPAQRVLAQLHERSPAKADDWDHEYLEDGNPYFDELLHRDPQGEGR